MSPKYEAGKSNPFEQDELRAFDAQTYGAVPDVPDSGRIIARPIQLESVYPDLRQPRRVIPASVRAGWDGDPIEMPTLLGNWHLIVEHKLGRELDLPNLLAGVDLEIKTEDPIVEQYFEVLRLAASIHADGLQNPIRVVRSGAQYRIESGERRWVAYWLLYLFVATDYSAIPAVESARMDVWAQAAENGARAPLNAIQMARQLALLVMDMYEGDKDAQFDDYQTLVLPGECDRKFYAQVGDGTAYPIRRGFGERVLQVTGLKSRHQISQYRALLNIPDALWDKADEQNWTEFAIREYAASIKPEAPAPTPQPEGKPAPKSGDVLTAVNLQPTNTTPNADVTAPNGFTVVNPQGSESGVEKPPSSIPADEFTGFDDSLFEIGQMVRVRADGGVAAIVSKREYGPKWYYRLDGRQRDYAESELEVWEAASTRRLYVDEPAAPARPAAPASTEPATPILQALDAAEVTEIALRMLRNTADNPEMESCITELLTMSRKDIEGYIQRNGADTWARWHGTAVQWLLYGMQQMHDALESLMDTVEQAGHEIEAKLAERE